MRYIHLLCDAASPYQNVISELREDIKSRPGASLSLDGTIGSLEKLKSVWRVLGRGSIYLNLSCIPRREVEAAYF